MADQFQQDLEILREARAVSRRHFVLAKALAIAASIILVVAFLGIITVTLEGPFDFGPIQAFLGATALSFLLFIVAALAWFADRVRRRQGKPGL